MTSGRKKYCIGKIAGWSSVAAGVLLGTITLKPRGQVSIMGSITEISLEQMVNV